MLKSIASIGTALIDGSDQAGWIHLVDNSNADDVFVIEFDGDGIYKSLSVEENEGGNRYLYRRDKSGKPGAFLTGRIPANDIRYIKARLSKTNDYNALLEDVKVRGFVHKKIGWYSKLKGIMADEDAVANISNEERNLLATALDQITINRDRIAKELFALISNGNYTSDVLITVKFGSSYPSEINGFTSVFKYVSQVGKRRKKNTSKQNTSLASCIICNSSTSGEFRKEPLQFITFDKQNFTPGGVKEHMAKALSLCNNCYQQLQIGERYIRNNLDFGVPYTKGATRLSFWLIPMLKNSELVEMFVKTQDKNLASFKTMWKIAGNLEAAKQLDSSVDLWSEKESASSMLSYSALFYYKDDNAHMRPVEMADGILPSRLSELARKKFEVDKIESFQMPFHFGLIQEFLFSDNKDDAEQMDDFRMVSDIMSSIFTAKKLNRSVLVAIVMRKIRQRARRKDSKGLVEVTLKALAFLDYLFLVGCLENNRETDTSEDYETILIFINPNPSAFLSPNPQSTANPKFLASIPV